ncbi:MAG TPA: SGNH/GDSL hydrolase family protein [Candidatus Polarisedimenticolaceae bacterium]|nr:SGNH/GDSL hydrolase family protein [Candidatus Polarisedimenticolaceae bacterium]
MPRLRAGAQNLALLAGALSIALLLAEAGTRLFTDIQPPISRRHPVVGRTYRPHYVGVRHVSESGHEVRLRFDRDGFRGPDRPYERPAGVRRLALIGDSIVAAIGCQEEDTAAAVLERLLRASQPEVRWEVLNFGVSGSSTGQELVLWRELASRYHPDLVVVGYFAGNDFADNSRRLTQSPRIYFRLDDAGRLEQLPLATVRKRASAWLDEHSRLYVLQKYAKDLLKQRTFDALRPLESGAQIFRVDDGGELAGDWALNLKLIEEFRDDVERRGTPFALALFPCGAQVDPEVWKRLLERAGALAPALDAEHPERRIAAFCAEHGIPLIPMLEEFRRAPRETPLFFQGDGHFSEAGNRLAAEAIHAFLTTGAGRQLLRRAQL